MQLDFGQMSQTIAIGALTFFGIVLITFDVGKVHTVIKDILLWKDVKPWIKELRFLSSAVFLALIFALGILIEDVSKDLAARPKSILSMSRGDRYLETAFPSEQSVRAKMVYELESETDEFFRLSPGRIMLEMLRFDVFSHQIDSMSQRLNRHFHQHIDDYENQNVRYTREDVRVLEAATIFVYYHAKNTLYGKATYFEELGKIGSRLDFARSLLLLGIFLFGAGLIHFLWVFMNWSFHKQPRPRLSLRIPVLLLFFVLVWLSGRTAYNAEQNNLNSRVWGYFATLEEHRLSQANVP
jgi:hypothetical protein